MFASRTHEAAKITISVIVEKCDCAIILNNVGILFFLRYNLFWEVVMTIYEGLGGAIAYTVEGNKIYRGLSNDVAYMISGNTIYEGMSGNIAYKLDGKIVYKGLGNTIAYKIDGNNVYEGLGGNIAFKIDSSSSRRSAASTASAYTEQPTATAYTQSSSFDTTHNDNNSDWSNFLGEGSDLMDEVDKFGQMSRGEIDIHGDPLSQQSYTSIPSSKM